MAVVCAGGAPLGAQASPAQPLLDALSITLLRDSVSLARGSLRLRQVRTGAEVELVASGIVVRRGLRVTAELRTDTAFVLHRYVAESRDSSGVIIDRVQVTTNGSRVTLERVTPRRRLVREYPAQRDLMLIDSTAVVPFVLLAGIAPQTTVLTLLDVRSGALLPARLTPGVVVDLSMAEVDVSATPIEVAGLSAPLAWWRDVRGHLLRVAWGSRSRIVRDDPPT